MVLISQVEFVYFKWRYLGEELTTNGTYNLDNLWKVTGQHGLLEFWTH